MNIEWNNTPSGSIEGIHYIDSFSSIELRIIPMTSGKALLSIGDRASGIICKSVRAAKIRAKKELA